MKLSRYSFLQRINIEALYNKFLGLQPKEQIYALVGGAFVILLIFGLPISLASSKLSSLEEQIAQGQERHQEILKELEEYQKIRAHSDAMEQKVAQGYDSTLTTTMEQLADKSGIKDRIENIKERGATSTEDFDEVAVEVRLTKVTVPQFMDYLYSIEHHPRLILRVKELRITRRYDNRQLLDVPTLRVSTYRLQKPGA